MPTILWIMKKNITRPARNKNTESVQRNKYEWLSIRSLDVLGTWVYPCVHCSINVDVANRVNVMLSTRLISHKTLTMVMEAAGGDEGFCPILGDSNL